MQNIASLSVVTYARSDKKLFDYVITDKQIVMVGSVCEVTFNHRKSLAIVRKLQNTIASHELKPIEKVLDLPPIPIHLLSLADWMIDYYVASCRSVWQTLLPAGIKQRPRQKIEATPSPTHNKDSLTLTKAQLAVLEQVRNTSKPALLHGVTGSGKTEIYLNLIAEVLSQNKSVIILVPEIIMTPQIIEQLSLRFAEQLLISHSKLTAAARKKVWLKCLNSEGANVVVGPRSALFLPVKNLGLIIVDEEHEQSYKQEQSPRYHASFVAAQLARLTKAKLLLGSATPSIMSYWLATQGRLELVQLPDRVSGVEMPSVKIVDLRKDHELLGKTLTSAIDQHLKEKNQVMLFLNRRGSASALLCEDCGHTIKCSNCETSLTFHADSARLQCHYCGFSILPPAVCPNCHQTDLHYIGTGTKGIEEKIQKLYAGYSIARLDRDNSDLAHIEQTYKALKDGTINILIGTQMIARGLDISGVQFVGVILADSMLNIPDFSASERTFQLLTQVAGRAGRRQARGEVLIQTYLPDNPAIIAASKHDYRLFYQYELAIRERYLYPPFCYLAKLSYAHVKLATAEKNARSLSEDLKKNTEVTVLGPVPSFIPRAGGKYQWQVILKSRDRGQLVRIAQKLKPGWTIDLDPINLI